MFAYRYQFTWWWPPRGDRIYFVVAPAGVRMPRSLGRLRSAYVLQRQRIDAAVIVKPPALLVVRRFVVVRESSRLGEGLSLVDQVVGEQVANYKVEERSGGVAVAKRLRLRVKGCEIFYFVC